MLKFILQVFALVATLIVLMFVLGWLMPIFTNPIVFVVIVSLIGLFAVKIAVRG
jgi:hypothetical protein